MISLQPYLNNSIELDNILSNYNNININEINNKGYNILTTAVSRNLVDTVKVLIEHGADLNYVCNKKYTAFGIAMHNNYVEIINMLYNAGVDIIMPCRLAIVNNDKMFINFISHFIPVDSIIIDEYYTTMLFFAVKYQRSNIMEILIDAGADVNIQNYSLEVPLMKCKNMRCLSLLVNAPGINLNAQNKYGETAVFKYTDERNIEFVSYLLKHNADANITDIDGNTALIQACIKNEYDLVKLLINYTDLNIKNSENLSALNYAQTESIQKLLLVAGISIYNNGTTFISNFPRINYVIEKIHNLNTAHMIGSKFKSQQFYDPLFYNYIGNKI